MFTSCASLASSANLLAMLGGKRTAFLWHHSGHVSSLTGKSPKPTVLLGNAVLSSPSNTLVEMGQEGKFVWTFLPFWTKVMSVRENTESAQQR